MGRILSFTTLDFIRACRIEEKGIKSGKYQEHPIWRSSTLFRRYNIRNSFAYLTILLLFEKYWRLEVILIQFQKFRCKSISLLCPVVVVAICLKFMSSHLNLVLPGLFPLSDNLGRKEEKFLFFAMNCFVFFCRRSMTILLLFFITYLTSYSNHFC